MGACFSDDLTPEERQKLREEKAASKLLDDNVNAQRDLDEAQKKLLLLGAGESGKSTLFKQMISLYGKGYSESDRKGYTHIVYNNTISAMKILVKHSDTLDDELDTKIRPDCEEAKKFVNECSAEIEIDEVAANHIKQLWKDEGIANAFKARALYQLPDSANYFFDRLDDIAQSDYLPTQQDVLRSRVRTTGIVETEFEIEKNIFKMYDVGGQRNERKKWIHCFENVTAVIFVAALSEYDQVLYEDETTNRMIEALNLFDEICNSRWFRETSIILFLNKRDLFEQKVKEVDMSVCFPEYDGGLDFDKASDFIDATFIGKNKSPEKDVYSHITCATDTNNVKHVFDSVKDIVIRQSLLGGGLM